MSLIIVLPLLMALFSVGSSVWLATISNPRSGLLQGFSPSILLALFVVLIGSLLAGLAVAVGIIKPLQQLTSKLENMAAGNFMQPLDMAAEREIESLAQAFNTMMSSLNRYILEGMAGAAITVDGSRKIVNFNPVAEIVFGYPQDQVLGKPLGQVIPEGEENKDFYRLIDDALENFRNCIGQELLLITRQGEKIQVRLSVSLLKGDGGTRVGILATFKNLAEIQRLREQLQRADQLMTIGTMTAGIAHEIRNPLGSISGLLQLLREDVRDDEQKLVYIDTIMKATDRINNLIEDMLALANPSLGRTEPRPINDVLHETLSFAQYDHLAKDIEIVEQYDPTSPQVMMDHERLGQAILNILRNAYQATPAKGRITISTLRSSREGTREVGGTEMIRISLHNTGSYIPPENYRQIFTPFFSTKKEGSGLGLSITKQIIAAHGGVIEVESSREDGTTFLIELPLHGRRSAAA